MKMSGVQIIIKICNIQSCICHIGYLNKNSSVHRMVQGMAQIRSYFVEEKKITWCQTHLMRRKPMQTMRELNMHILNPRRLTKMDVGHFLCVDVSRDRGGTVYLCSFCESRQPESPAPFLPGAS